jgi:hypothetical protein
MKPIDYIDLFDREEEKKELEAFIQNFDAKNKNQTKGMYILGPVGCGKTEFVKTVIKNLDEDYIIYDAGKSRTKNIIIDIMGLKISNTNVMNLFHRKKDKKKIIIMDEMDYMNIGDKGGIKEMIKYTRAKKTKKQISEPQTMSPIVYIGSGNNDKKIKELINVCKVIEFNRISNENIYNYLSSNIPELRNTNYHEFKSLSDKIIFYANGNLHKINLFVDFYNKTKSLDELKLMVNSITMKFNQNMYTKSIVKELYTRYIPISEYSEIVKETDRTTLGLLWHENLDSILSLNDKKNNFDNANKNLELYDTILKNLCISDYNDRIIFQNQIWQLSEQNSFIKTLYNNFLLHKNIEKINIPNEIIFTKVLTKYSTEYNNFIFLQHLEQKTFMNKKRILHLFLTNEEFKEDFYLLQLDIDRMVRFLKSGEFTCDNCVI